MATATAQDAQYMRRALELAEGGRGRVSPNPLVGAVLVRDGAVIGEGFHAELGGLHAETAALADCRERGEDPAGATLHVTLEPCAHTGRQPPCSQAILEAGVARVVIGSDDPSEKAAGRGPEMLRERGVEVEFAEGAEAEACRMINQAFRKHALTGRPWVVLKVAITADGLVSRTDGERWISGEESRALVHRWRAEMDGVAIGIETALADDPLLTARDVDAVNQPARVVFDSEARLPLDSKLVKSIDEARLLVVVAPGAPSERVEALESAGAELFAAPGPTPPGRVVTALTELGRRDISSLLLEPGPTLAESFRESGEVDEVRIFMAPEVGGNGDGGRNELPLEEPAPIASWTEQVGEDLLIRARMKEW